MSDTPPLESDGTTELLPASQIEQVPQGPLSLLLVAPKRFGWLVSHDQMELSQSLKTFAAAILFYALYGVAMGAFSSGHALWLAGLKLPLIALASAALCAPSLYVLLGLNGSAISMRQAVAILSGATCLTSILLVGFAPVAWLFGVSTTSLQFMVLLHLGVWGVGLAYGLRLLGVGVPNGYQGNRILVLWIAVFLLVGMQMTTYFRPLLVGSPTGTFRLEEKKFFFQHFYESMAGSDAPPQVTKPTTHLAAVSNSQ